METIKLLTALEGPVFQLEMLFSVTHVKGFLLMVHVCRVKIIPELNIMVKIVSLTTVLPHKFLSKMELVSVALHEQESMQIGDNVFHQLVLLKKF